MGEGGFGCVYKGVLADGKDVAVKQLKIGGGQGEHEFRAEVEIISRIHHRYLVSLAGYCISEHQRLLVYEYVPNNTLHYHLHGKKYFSDEMGRRNLKFEYHLIHKHIVSCIWLATKIGPNLVYHKVSLWSTHPIMACHK